MASGLRLAICLYAAAAGLWALSERALEYPAFAAVLLELLVAAWLFPAARFQLGAPLSPRNWALLLFHLHLLVAPLLGIGLGFARGTLPRLPSPSFINAALLLGALAHFCFALGAQLSAGNPPRSARPPLRFSGDVHGALAAIFVVLGLCGLWLIFGGPGGYLRYVTTPETHTLMEAVRPNPREASGTFLRPFLAFGLLLLWSRGAGARRRGRYLVPTLLLVLALVPATASYNRASMLGPVLAALAAYSLTVRRLSARTVALAGAGLLAAALSFGAYRNANLAGPDTPYQARSSPLQEANEFIQIYAEGPQLLGFLLERTQGEPLHLGRSLFASVLSPVPVLGKPFREQSGVYLYNRLVYGTSGIVDQIIPASGELFLNFHLAGVAAFFALLGFAVLRVEHWFRSAPTAFDAAAAFYLGMWISFPIAGSVAVLSQILIYSLWPLYAYYGLRAALGACLAPGGRRGPAFRPGLQAQEARP